LESGLIDENTQINYALACGHIYSTRKLDDEPLIRRYFDEMGWKLFTPKDIKDKIKIFQDKGWEDNIVIMTAKLTKEAIS